MSVTVPSSDPENYTLYNDITTLTTQIANATAKGNFPLAGTLTSQKAHKQFHLVLGLLGSGAILASSVLSSCTYAKPTQPGGDQTG